MIKDAVNFILGAPQSVKDAKKQVDQALQDLLNTIDSHANGRCVKALPRYKNGASGANGKTKL